MATKFRKIATEEAFSIPEVAAALKQVSRGPSLSLDKTLVRDEQLAVSASAGMYALQRVGIFFVQAVVKPGVDPALVEKRLDELVAQYIAEGPTEAEVQRATLDEVGGRIRALEQVGDFGGKAVTLAEGQTFAHDSDFYKKTLATYASITPAEVQAAMKQWLTRPALSIKLEPGERPPYVETQFKPDNKVPPTKTAAAPGPKRGGASGSAFSIGRSSSSRAVSTADPIASSVPPFSTNVFSFVQPASPTP